MRKALFALAVLLPLAAGAQSLDRACLTTAGADLDLPSGGLSFSVGQAFTPTLTNGNSLTLGFQQPPRARASSSPAAPLALSAEAFPNPCQDQLSLRLFSKGPMPAIRVELFDMMGRPWPAPIQQQAFGMAWSAELRTDHLPAGTYLCRLLPQDPAAEPLVLRVIKQ